MLRPKCPVLRPIGRPALTFLELGNAPGISYGLETPDRSRFPPFSHFDSRRLIVSIINIHDSMLQRFIRNSLMTGLLLGIFPYVSFNSLAYPLFFLIHCCLLFFVYVSLLMLFVYGQSRSVYRVVNCISHGKIDREYKRTHGIL